MHSPRAVVVLLVALGLLIAVRPAEAARAGNLWVSLDSQGNQFSAASGAYSYPPALTGDGALVAFESIAALQPEIDNNDVSDVYLRDTNENVTTVASVTSGGGAGNNRSFGPSISADGTLVAFESLASNMVEGDGNNMSDVFVRDLAAGETLRVSVPAGGEDANGSSYRPAISADGAFVGFCSRASNLVSGDSNGVADAFLWERATGAITRIEVPGAGEAAADGCLRVSVSGDANVVAFSAVTGGSAAVFAYDRQAGTTANLAPEADGPSGTGGISVSGDGGIIAFDSVADNLTDGDTNRSRDVFVSDRRAGTITRASVRSNGSQLPGDSGSSGLSVSGDGRFVVFGSTARGVVPGDSNGREDVFRHDIAGGQTLIASVNVSGESANNSSYSPSINSDGEVVAFTSLAANVVGGDGNRQPDIFLRGTSFPDKAGNSSEPEDTGAPEEEATQVVQPDGGGTSPLLIYGGIGAGVLLLLLAASLLLGRRGRA